MPVRFVFEIGRDLLGMVGHDAGQALELLARRRSLIAHQFVFDRCGGEGRGNACADREPNGTKQ